jgi:hypothetical protein
MADAKGDAFEQAMIRLIFLGTSIAGLAQNSNAPMTHLSIQLHTASPGETGSMVTNDATYTGYERVGVERTSTGWDVSGTTAKLAAAVTFPVCGGGTNTITHFSIGNSTVAASTGAIYYYGAVTPNLSVASGVTPRLTTATAVSEL